MRIGIKYCGGCNPSFNRTKIVKLLGEEFAEVSFEYVVQNVSYDLIIAICGCARACINSINLNSRKIVFITKEADFISLKETMNGIYTK